MITFKGEIAFGTLNSKFKTGFNIGDVYCIQGCGNLVPNNYPAMNGEFVEWTGNGWRHSDVHYITNIEFEEIMYADQEIPESTLRFSFGDLNYDPTQDTAVASRHNTADRAGGGTPAGYGGTWTKLRTKYTNIWDYTYVDNTLLNEFDNGVGLPSNGAHFWSDVENNPIKIIASNTSGCTNFKRAFQGVCAITEIWELDTSDAANVQIMFSSMLNLRKVPKLLDFSSVTVSANAAAVFQYDSALEEVDEIRLPDDSSLSLNIRGMFDSCKSLRRIVTPINLKAVTNASFLFYGCENLNDVSIENIERVTNFEGSFATVQLPKDYMMDLNPVDVTNFHLMLSGYAKTTAPSGDVMCLIYKSPNITEIPAYDYSKASSIEYMFYSNTKLKHLDATKFASLKTSCNVEKLFCECRNVETGILETYNMLVSRNPSNHTDCFLNCGIDTPAGRAELEQIPASWGGLAEG